MSSCVWCGFHPRDRAQTQQKNIQSDFRRLKKVPGSFGASRSHRNRPEFVSREITEPRYFGGGVVVVVLEPFLPFLPPLWPFLVFVAFFPDVDASVFGGSFLFSVDPPVACA